MRPRLTRIATVPVFLLLLAVMPAVASAQYEGPVISGQNGTFRVTATAGEPVVLQSPTPDLGSVQLTFNADFSGQITFTERSTPPATTARPQLLLGAIGALPLFGLSATPQAGAPPATVDRYIEVDRGGAPSSVVSRAVFQFRAPSSDNGVALQTTGDNGQWRPLATAAKAVDGTQTVYTATSPALYGLYAVTYAAGAAPGLPNTGQGGGIWGGMLWIVPALALAAGLGVALRRFARG